MPDPMYRQIAEDLRRKIESGELGPGSQLPTELELREKYIASRNTVRDAIKLLVTGGLVETRPGHGTFVVRKIDPFVTNLDIHADFKGGDNTAYEFEVTSQSRTSTVSSPRIEIHEAADLGSLTKELQLEAGTSVVSRHQRRYIDDTAWSLQTSFYPMSFVEQGAAEILKAVDMPDGVMQYVKDLLDIEQVGVRSTIAVRAPDTNETTFFGLPPDGRVAVFEIRRTAFDASGKPLRLTITVYPADRNQFVMSVGKVRDEPEITQPN